MIECIEEELCCFLGELKPLGISVIPTPENMAEFKKPITQPKVTALFSQIKYEDQRSTDMVIQDEWLHFDIVIQSRILRGNLGIYSLFKVIKKMLLGRRCTKTGDNFQAVTFVPWDDNPAPDIWTYVFQVRVKAIAIQNTFDFNEYPLLTSVTWDSNIE